jgi:hypothetical protein
VPLHYSIEAGFGQTPVIMTPFGRGSAGHLVVSVGRTAGSKAQPLLASPEAADSQAAPVENVGVDHGRLDILMPQEFLDGTDVIMGFEEVGRKTVAQGAGTNRFDDARQAGCLFDRLL